MPCLVSIQLIKNRVSIPTIPPYNNKDYVLGGIYRHPNGVVDHFVNDLETTLSNIDDKMTAIIVGDIDIDIIKS